MKLVKTSYDRNDVTILLKDLTNSMVELEENEREKLIQGGTHYSEMLPREEKPSEGYEELYHRAIERNSGEIARCVAVIAEMMLKKCRLDLYETPIIVSLARAGTPVGVLVKKYIKIKYGIDVKHYSVSIVRDKGIDVNAMEHIYFKEIIEHKNKVKNIMFVDGWTGKGVIKKQLDEAVEHLMDVSDRWSELSNSLYVLADPASVTENCGTNNDILLPSACLNSTVSGLISRTILNSYIDTKNGDFHGAAYFKKFEEIDRTNEFINSIESVFYRQFDVNSALTEVTLSGKEVVKQLCEEFGIEDYRKVKPGIGETTRVLLRRVPWKVFINENLDVNDADIQHILLLCNDKNIPVERFDLGNYKVCGVIKDLSADA
jgi:hypothetical protein